MPDLTVVPGPSGDSSWQEMVGGMLPEDGFAYLGTWEAYAVQSKSDPQDWHYVLYNEVLNVTVCGKCRGFRFRNTCEHVKRFEKDVLGGVDSPE